ncbi:MAG: bifunctional riboflavin kinase/FAD synthetase [Myxococcota bacterium]|jgi:riboflavin kinase/FMN adenylyltransferase|nr:bifunctional riboflavin kinase/FAD synthetase [Myxococcota bacterium]
MPQVFAGSAAFPSTAQPALSMGNFDGLHLGHQFLIGRLVERARELDVPTCVYTFDPPPRVVLAPTQVQPRILPWPEKVRLLGELGVDQVIVERFTHSFAQHPPEWFVDEVLVRRLAPRCLVLGYDFRFGRARAGTIDMVRERMAHTPIDQVKAFDLDGTVVSSSAIRKMVGEGDVEKAAGLLGRPYCLRGTVVGGDRRGRTIGFPTANVDSDSELIPARGVYAVKCRVDGGPTLDGVANLGTRPTFDGRRFLVEVHLLDGSHGLYGRELMVEFVARIRDEVKFSGVEELKAQIRNDVLRARDLLAEHQTDEES